MRRAGALGDVALLELFNRAYSDYFVPLRLDAGALRTMVETFDLDLGASPIADLDGSPAGFALLGLRGDEGWIGGMGVVSEARRRGLGRALMEAAIEEARARGVRELRLEVLEQNAPALALYRRLGFEHERDLDVWSLPGGGAASSGAETVAVDDAHTWLAARRPSREPWQRADATLAHLRRREPPPAALALGRGDERVGAAVYGIAGGVAAIQQAAVSGDDPDRAALLLVGAVRFRAEGVRWLNAPAGEPGSTAMAALGAVRVARQHELVLPLRA